MSPRHTTLSWVEVGSAGESRRTIVEPGEIGRTRFVVVPGAIDHDLTVLDAVSATSDPADDVPRPDGLLRPNAARPNAARLTDDTTLLLQRGPGGQER
jgi:hypothetical protein